MSKEDKQKIKVLYVIDKYGIGGVESIAYTLIEKFYSNKIDIFFYFIRDLRIKKKIKNNKVLIDNSSILNPYPFYRIFRIIRNAKISIVHTHQKKGFFIACVLSLFLKSVKFIHHDHGDILLSDPLYKLALNIFSNRFTKIITVSIAGKDQLILKAKIDSKKIVVLHNFVDLKKFDFRKKNVPLFSKENLDIKDNDFIIGFVGRLSKEKGVDCLIKAASFLNNNCKVLIVGDGILRKDLEKNVDSLNLRKQVLFLGYVDEISQIYPLFDVLVAPSHSEAFSLTVLEAQAMKIPVIVSDIDAFKSLLIDFETCLFFRENDGKDLAKKIKLIIKEGKLREILLNQGAKRAKEFSLSNFIPSLEKMYYEL